MAEWHPIMSVDEISPGEWIMRDGQNKPYGIIRIVRRAGQVGYRADMWPEVEGEVLLVGYFTKLKAAAKAVHTRHIANIGGYRRGPVGITNG